MIGDILFLLIMWAAAFFLANRLYVIVRYKAINIKGVTYSRAETPIMYCVQLLILMCGLAMIGGIAVLLSLPYLGLLR